MSAEMATVADLGTTSLALADVEKGSATTTSCANCDVPLEGKYCHACGQVAHAHRSLLPKGEEFLHSLLHFDTKAAQFPPQSRFTIERNTHRPRL